MVKGFNENDLIPTRRSLLTRLKDWGDRTGWQQFFDTYWRLIYNVAIKAGLADTEAQEVVQETLFEVARKMPGFKYDPAVGSFKAWLLHTTRWRISAQFRLRERSNRSVPLPEESDTATAAFEELADPVSLDWDAVWEAEWERNLFQAAVEKVKTQVSARQFEIFYLHVLKDKPVKRVTDALEVSAGQVYVATYRVGRLLKKEVQRLRRAVT
jgi:RNA polymerase sigma factor (sigma-70 family)